MDLSKVAFRKAVLHSLKHSTVDCVGVLISNGNEISDVIPLFHESVVGPSLDAAFTMLQDFYLTPNPSFKIVGVYEASVSASEDKFLPSTLKILESIKEYNHESPLVLRITNKEDDENKEISSLDVSLHKYNGDNKTDSLKGFQ